MTKKKELQGEAERRRGEKEQQILEAEKEAKSLIPLNKDYEKHILNSATL